MVLKIVQMSKRVMTRNRCYSEPLLSQCLPCLRPAVLTQPIDQNDIDITLVSPDRIVVVFTGVPMLEINLHNGKDSVFP